MTRKRFVKLVMADRISRNEALMAAQIAREKGMNYELAYKGHQLVICAMTLCAVIGLEENTHDA